MPRMLILIAIVFAMAGCPDGSQPPPPNPTEELLQREREQRLQAEANRDKERAGKEKWQSLATVSVISAVILLITGTILGSRAKHDAELHE